MNIAVSVFSLSLLSCSAFAAELTVNVQDSAGKPLANVVVYAEADGAAALPKLQKAAEIEQKGLKFLPLVTVIQTGSKISFPNNDKVRHHIYSFSPAKKFDQKLYSGVAASPQVFDKAGTVVLGCNIHDRMIAYVKVVDTPYFGKTDDKGVVQIDVPVGKYKLTAWHYHMANSVAPELPLTMKEGSRAAFTLALKPPVQDADAMDQGY